MIIGIRNNKVAVFDLSVEDASTYPGVDEIVVIPKTINVMQCYADAGYDIENLAMLPDPRTNGILSVEQIVLTKIATAKFNRNTAENTGVVWNGRSFKSDTKTCSSLLGTIQSVQGGTLAEPIGWRCADGEFVDLTLLQLQEVAAVVVAATEANFAAERAEIAA